MNRNRIRAAAAAAALTPIFVLGPGFAAATPADSVIPAEPAPVQVEPTALNRLGDPLCISLGTLPLIGWFAAFVCAV